MTSAELISEITAFHADRRRSGVSLVHELVLTGRITPQQGALVLELRRGLQRRRRPWWRRALSAIARVFA